MYEIALPPAAANTFPRLFEPGLIGTLELPNRVIKSPLATGMAHLDGTVSERLLRHYGSIASGGVGLVMVEYAYVDNIASKAAPRQLAVSTDEHITGLAHLAEVIHWRGPKAGCQIVHAGFQRASGLVPMKVPSTTFSPTFSGAHEELQEELTLPEISELARAFGAAAARAVKAGYDVVEIHGAHGYLITNFLSPQTNHRDDRYGGSFENRLRFLAEVIESVRANVPPDFPLSLRLNGADPEPDGITLEEAVATAKRAERLGIDAIHVSGGDHRAAHYIAAPQLVPRGQNVAAAAAIKSAVDVPVIVVGSLVSPADAEDVLAAESADFVALGRALLADPKWPLKAVAGRPEEVRPCIRCNDGCLDRTMLEFRAITCSVNPNVGMEGETRPAPAGRARRVAVVGGGVAGLEAARVGAERGHFVTLFERSRLGGQLVNACEPEFKADLRPYLAWLVRGLEHRRIKVVTREAVAAELVSFDAVLVATGSRPKKLDGVGPVGDGACKVVVVGGGATGVEAAIQAAARGGHVTLVEQEPALLQNENSTDRQTYANRLRREGVEVRTSTRASRLDDAGVVVAGPDGPAFLAAEKVVVAIGVEPDRSLADRLRGTVEVHVVGDAVRPGRIHDAVHSAHRAALGL